MSKSANILLLILLVFASVLVGIADYVVTSITLRQALASGFATTRGRIVYSQVTQRKILRGGITIRYVYAVDGRNYGASRYRYDDHNLAMRWEEAVQKFPDHSQTTVYFNPKDPANALLSPGVSGGDLLLLLLSAPVSIALILLWSAAVLRVRDKWAIGENGGVKTINAPGQLRIRMADTPALAAAFYGSGGAAFICAFPVVVLCGFDPSVRLMTGIWAAILLVGVGAFCWKALLNISGKHDLVIDEVGRSVTLPVTCQRRLPAALPLGTIIAVGIQRRVSQTRSGGYPSYFPTLRWQDEHSAIRDAPLVGWGWSEEKARAFSLWLSRRLAIRFIHLQEENTNPIQ